MNSLNLTENKTGGQSVSPEKDYWIPFDFFYLFHIRIIVCISDYLVTSVYHVTLLDLRIIPGRSLKPKQNGLKKTRKASVLPSGYRSHHHCLRVCVDTVTLTLRYVTVCRRKGDCQNPTTNSWANVFNTFFRMDTCKKRVVSINLCH